MTVWLTRLVWAACALLSGWALVVTVADFAAGTGGMAGVSSVQLVVQMLALLVFPLVTALILSGQPRNVIGWLLLLPIFGLAPSTIAIHAWFGTAAPPADLSLAGYLAVWYLGWSWVVLVFSLLLIALLFPTGAPPSPRWWWVARALGVQAAVFIGVVTFSPTLTPSGADGVTWSVANPLAFITEALAGAIILPWIGVLGLLAILCGAALFVRYRQAGAVVRTQLRWLLFASTFFLVVYVPGLYFNYAGESNPTSLFGVLWNLGFALMVALFPVAIAVAVLRYRLWDIDVIIRRTLIYSALTAALALTYFGSVLVLQNIFQALTGESSSALVTVISTLFIAALFGPLRGRIQRAIDRRFYRRKYDAARTLAAFGTQARDEVGLEQLAGQLERVVEETMQPASVSLWVRDQSAH